jgi:hypothetical protein
MSNDLSSIAALHEASHAGAALCYGCRVVEIFF